MSINTSFLPYVFDFLVGEVIAFATTVHELSGSITGADQIFTKKQIILSVNLDVLVQALLSLMLDGVVCQISCPNFSLSFMIITLLDFVSYLI